MNGEESPHFINKIARTLMRAPGVSENRSELSCRISRTATHAAHCAAGSRAAILGDGFVRVLLWISPFYNSQLSKRNRISNRNQTTLHGNRLTRRARRLGLMPDFVLVEIPCPPDAERQSRKNNDRQ